MRKDAKIGFAIGAVLLAVLTVYAIVVPKKRTVSPQGVKVVLPQSVATNTPSRNVDFVEIPKSTFTATPPSTPEVVPPAVADTSARIDSSTPKNTEVATADTGRSPDGVNWDRLVGGVPAMQSATPGGSPAADDSAPAGPLGTSPVPVADSGTLMSFKPGDDSSSAGSKTGASNSFDPPAPAKTGSSHRTSPRTHSTNVARGGGAADSVGTYVVEAGDTLSGIAAQKYGAAHYYIQLQKANPSLNPNRLRPGTKLVMPDLSTQIASAKSGETTVADLQSPRTSIRLDAGNAAGGGVFTPSLAHETLFATNADTYTVKPGDNLYKISKTLYGTTRMAREIYSSNHDTIGSNMAHVKVGMVLTLPQAPTN